MPNTETHPCDKSQVIGKFESDITHLKTGLERAEELIEKMDETLNRHELNAEARLTGMKSELDRLRAILKMQTDRVTELMNVTAANTKWLQQNGSLVQAVADHEERITDLEGNRSFAKGVVWLIGAIIALFGIAPLIVKLIEFYF